MLLLSPVKLLVVLLVALVVVGPEKLPPMMRKVGSYWSEFKKIEQKMSGGLRDAFPDLPPTSEIAAAVRSPLTLMDRLAESAVPVTGAADLAPTLESWKIVVPDGGEPEAHVGSQVSRLAPVPHAAEMN